MPRRVLSLAAVLTVSAFIAGGAAWVRFGVHRVHDDMAGAASRLVKAFPDSDRPRINLRFDDAAREDWHFVPRSRPGVRLADMNDAQRAAARDLLRSALSSQGVMKVELIMSLDSVLREMENNPGRDPLQYTFTVYGEPGAAQPWGWKIEGHHISLNFTCAGGTVIGVTPSFLGANPGEVKSGPRAGQRALAVEEDVARDLVKSLDDAQRAAAVISDKAPADILTTPGRPLDAAASEGLAYEKMNEAQRAMIDTLLREYAHTLRQELAHDELARIDAAEGGRNTIRFAWAGGFNRGEGHYYRITGPTFVIEYDNTQNNANHPHTIWHDRARNFGHDALRKHYQKEHAAPR